LHFKNLYSLKKLIIILIFFVNAFTSNAQSSRAFYTNQELLKFPVEAAYHLNRNDEYALSVYLNNQLGLKLDNESVNKFSIFTQTLDGSYDFDNTITFFSLIVDKRSPDYRIQSWYLKTKGREVMIDKSFFQYLINHPKAISNDNGIALLLGGINKKNIESQKVIIGITPDYLSNPLQYTVFFLKNDNSMSLNEILREIYY
jgi:hypothetical protein